MSKKLSYILNTIIAVIILASVIASSVISQNNSKNSNNPIDQEPVPTSEVVLPKTLNAHVSAPSYDIYIDTAFTYNNRTILSGSYDKFNAELAKLSLLLCLDSVDNVSVRLPKDTNTDTSDNVSFPASLGFEETLEFFVGEDETIDENDTTKITISLNDISDEFVDRFAFINVSFAPTDSSSEWLSNFDIGSPNTELYKGEHPDWSCKDNHKGFDVAATRAIETIQTYLMSVPLDHYKAVVFNFTGYSRGAAVANLVASKFNTTDFYVGDNAYFFAYTFATPLCTVNANASSYKNIYNIVNYDDIVTNVPPASMGYTRYGQDVQFDLNAEGNESLRGRYLSIYKTQYCDTYIQDVVTGLNSICQSREAFYSINLEDMDAFCTRSFATRDEAESQQQTWIDFFESVCPGNYEEYVLVTPVTEDVDNSTFVVSFNYAPQFIMKLAPKALDYIGSKDYQSALSILDYINFGKYKSLHDDLIRMVLFNSSALENMHLPVPYYIYIESLSTAK